MKNISKKLLHVALTGAFLIVATIVIVGFSSSEAQTSKQTSQIELQSIDYSTNAAMDFVGSKCGDDDKSKTKMKKSSDEKCGAAEKEMKSKEEKCGTDGKEMKSKEEKCGGDDKEMKSKEEKCGGADKESKSKSAKDNKEQEEKCGTGKCG